MRERIAAAVKNIYEQHPYPQRKGAVKSAPLRIASTEWIKVVWQRESDPERILVAGCGTGVEAFALRNKFPESEIIAVDFSPRSIAIARESQNRSRGLKIHFFVGDLSDPQLKSTTGKDFDFISCHGVLSYINRPGHVLRNLRNLMKQNGALHLGVNGAAHFSVPLRKALPSFGIDLAELDLSVKEVLQLCDAIQGRKGRNRVARYSEDVLAGDLFGPLIHNLPLEDWIGMAEEAGLHFQSSFMSYLELRKIVENDLFLLLWPKSHAEVIRLIDLFSPAQFHRLLFTAKRQVAIPWTSPKKLQSWRPSFTSLYTAVVPKAAKPGDAVRKVTLKSFPVETQIDLNLPEWETAILRRCDGVRKMDDLLKNIPANDQQVVIQRLFYCLYQLLIIRMSPDTTV